MTNSNDTEKTANTPAIAPKKRERQQREAQALRENLKRRKQQLQARKQVKKADE